MFVYCGCGCELCREISAVQCYHIEFRQCFCEKLVRLGEIVPLKFCDCQRSIHPAMDLGRAIVGTQDAQSTVLDLSLTSPIVLMLKMRMSKLGFRNFIAKFVCRLYPTNIYPK